MYSVWLGIVTPQGGYTRSYTHQNVRLEEYNMDMCTVGPIHEWITWKLNKTFVKRQHLRCTHVVDLLPCVLSVCRH